MEAVDTTGARSGARIAAVLGRAAIVAILLSICGAGGCMRVRPYQREHLAHRSMVGDRGPGEERFERHARGAREGADGGSGDPGGGCGCN
jgi:hypothetical protein